MRSTILRLERQNQDQAQTLNTYQHAYEELAETVLRLAAEAGYLGRDPLGALTQLSGPQVGELRLGQLVLDLWRAFFSGFRADETEFEAAQFRAAAADLERRLAALQPGQAPDGDLAGSMLEALVGLWEERQDSINERLDLLIGEVQQQERRLGSANLDSAWREDEMERCHQLIVTALSEMGEAQQEAEGESLGQLLVRMVKRWRQELGRRSDELKQLRGHRERLLNALGSAAEGTEGTEGGDSELAESDRRVVAQVRDLVAACREQEELLRKGESDAARQQARLKELEHELAGRDQLLARYEFGERDPQEDQRLALYRRAVAAFEAGETPTGLLEEVRELERVFVIDERAQQQCTTLLDRHLDGLQRTLGQLRKIIPLSDDPRRFRPRLLGASPYRLKTLTGLVQASRDAARDLQTYVGRARWAAGVYRLNQDFKKLRSVFQEMVRLVGDCRDKLGGPPPVSCTIDIDTAEGLASLPAVLALDVKALLRGRGVAQMATGLSELMEDCVAMLHHSLEQARGAAIERSSGPKRESASKALARLADELVELAGIMDTVFAEARERSWTLPQPEQELLKQEHLMLLGLRDVDGTCQALQHLTGAPPADFDKLPSGKRSELDRLLAGCRERVRWLEEAGRYRVQLRGG